MTDTEKIEALTRRTFFHEGEMNLKILQLLGDGETMKGIGKHVHLSHRTVERRLNEIRVLHDAKNLHHLVSIAHRKGLIN